MDRTTITVDKSTLKRFNDLRNECQTDHAPAPSADAMLNSLMDEWEREQPLNGELPDIGEGEVAIVTNDHTTAERLADAIEAVGGDQQAFLDSEVPETLGEVRELIERLPGRTADELEQRFSSHP